MPEDYIDIIINNDMSVETLHLTYKKMLNNTCVNHQYVNVLWEDNYDSQEYIDELIRQVEFAHKYNVKKVVMHTTGGFRPTQFGEKGLRNIEKILNYCKNKKIFLCLENLRLMEPLYYIFDNLKSPFLKFCFDSGHANCMTKNIKHFPWKELGPYLFCVHLNDNFGNNDDHLIPFDGNIDWEKITKNMARYCPEIELTLETRMSDYYFQRGSEKDFYQHCFNSLKKLESLFCDEIRTIY